MVVKQGEDKVCVRNVVSGFLAASEMFLAAVASSNPMEDVIAKAVIGWTSYHVFLLQRRCCLTGLLVGSIK